MFQRSCHTAHHRVTKSLKKSDTRRANHSKINTVNHGRRKPAPDSTENRHPSCGCNKSLLPLCMLIPRQTFGNSYFTGPSVVLLRLLFQAASLQLNCRHSTHGRNLVKRTPGELTAGERFSESVLKPRRLAREQRNPSLFSHLNRKVSTDGFLEEVAASPARYAGYQVVSISWVKALASHMSHEFIQFVIEDSDAGRRLRLITDRQETGDWVITTESAAETASKFSWPKLSPYKDRHNLPLPLVSLTLDDPASRPSLLDMAKLIVEISRGAPSYNPFREHCWWYAEAIFEAVRSRYTINALREWPWAKYRYSFVLCNSWVRRKTLATHADEFERMCMNEMVY